MHHIPLVIANKWLKVVPLFCLRLMMSAPVKLPVDRSRESLGSLSEGWTSVSKQLLCLQTVMTSDTHTDLSAVQGVSASVGTLCGQFDQLISSKMTPKQFVFAVETVPFLLISHFGRLSCASAPLRTDSGSHLLSSHGPARSFMCGCTP